ncbi:MAG: undecaprenyldiphospho-muramoylpentapeptide beta-N-acetylglucosaminyltransferase [Ignavibacteriae bacterium HGW-Ignavibacteriae-3]|nr:MAG: undecaprenyldiphospho-muramoylpentapeptide beta-N-acetylglucosaminyltransferase [Ignavibacteriae bacterium HGW-Ignavibacteriae-3]
MKNKTPYRFVFAGGGTGGHLYPALAVAQQIRLIKPESEILFVGAKNKIEGRVVPECGFNFRSIWVSGFSRKFTLSNLLFPIKLFVSMLQSLSICFSYKPRVAVGSGAYVSGPVIWAASVLGAKVILLEQNSYPGFTNRLLEKRATEIHITFEESKKYFRDNSKLIMSGNPVRMNLRLNDRIEAAKKFGLDPSKKILLVIGGSGGARSINEAIAGNLSKMIDNGIQVVWQTGQFYFMHYKHLENTSVKIFPFISDMSAAYSSCDVVLARSGATTIAEIAFLGMPAIFVPSENVAANHQYKNAKALKVANAAELIEDKNLKDELFPVISEMLLNIARHDVMKKNISEFAKPMAAQTIAERAIRLAEII